MKRYCVTLEGEREKQFNDIIYAMRGRERGSVQASLEEAVELFIQKHKDLLKK